MHLNQLAALACVFGFTLRAVLHLRQRDAHFLRHHPHRFRKADLLALLDKLKNVAGLAAAKAMEELRVACTENDGVFSPWNGHSPTKFCPPAFLSRT